MYRSTRNEKTVQVSKVPIIIDKENVTIEPGKGNTLLSVLNDNTYKKLAFPCLFPKRQIWIHCCSRYTN